MDAATYLSAPVQLSNGSFTPSDISTRAPAFGRSATVARRLAPMRTLDPKPADASVRCEVCRSAVEGYEPGFAGGDGLMVNFDQTQDVISHLTPVFCRVKVAVADSINFLPRWV